MTTKELINSIAGQTRMTRKETEKLMDSMTKVIVKAMKEGQSVQFQNFGTLEPKERAARTITNPKTGERSVTQAKQVVNFRANTSLKAQVK